MTHEPDAPGARLVREGRRRRCSWNDTYRWEVGRPASQWPAQGLAESRSWSGSGDGTSSGEVGTGSNRRLERNGGESVTRPAQPGTFGENRTEPGAPRWSNSKPWGAGRSPGKRRTAALRARTAARTSIRYQPAAAGTIARAACGHCTWTWCPATARRHAAGQWSPSVSTTAQRRDSSSGIAAVRVASSVGTRRLLTTSTP